MGVNYKTNKACIEKIFKYINDIQTCLNHFSIASFADLENKRLAQLAITQSITNISEAKKLMSQKVLNKMPAFNDIKILAARNLASHDYENVNFRIIYDVCKKLTADTVMEVLTDEYNRL